MKLIEINWNPTDRQLRQFAVICMFALPFVGWLWNGSTKTVGLLATLGFILAILGIFLPAFIKPVFLALTLVASPIGLAVGELSMLFIYYGLFVPIGLVFWLMQRDGLQLKLDQEAESYWQPIENPKGVANYYRQS